MTMKFKKISMSMQIFFRYFKKILPDLMKHLSTRVSIMQLTHYYQNMINDNFRLFDHKQKNLIYYNAMTPPDYQLSLITAPLFLYHATEDRYASVKVFILISQPSF